MHSLLHRNTSDLSILRFSTRVRGDEFYLRDDVVGGSRVMSDGAHLEMARAAVEMAAGAAAKTGVHLQDVMWLRPAVVGEAGLELHIELFSEEDGKTAPRAK